MLEGPDSVPIDNSGSGLGWVPPEPSWLSQKLGAYRVSRLIGRGGMGAVYLAHQTSLDRQVAIKLLPPSAAPTEIDQARFTQEAQLMAKLARPTVVSVYDFGVFIDGSMFIVLEYVAGGSLADRLGAESKGVAGGLPGGWQEAVAVLEQLCDAVGYAHEQGLVHRDIKPANVLLTDVQTWGGVKLADFGIAKVVDQDAGYAGQWTTTGKVFGTPAYVAPESMRGEASDEPCVDVYALGVLFYEMLTGIVPHGAFAKVSETPGVPEGFDRVLLNALSSDPQKRYPSADAFWREANQVAKLAAQNTGKRKWLLSAGVGVLVLGVAVNWGAAFWIGSGTEPSNQGVTHQGSIEQQQPHNNPENATHSLVEESPAVLIETSPSETMSSRGVSGLPQGGWWSLLDQADLRRDVLDGHWRRVTEGVVSGADRSVLRLLFEAKSDYEVRVHFVRLSGRRSVALFFSTQQGDVACELDAWDRELGGLQEINGQNLRAHGESFAAPLQNGDEHVLRLVVRQDHILVYVDEQLMHRYDISNRRLSRPRLWGSGEEGGLAIGSWEAETLFRRVDVRMLP